MVRTNPEIRRNIRKLIGELRAGTSTPRLGGAKSNYANSGGSSLRWGMNF